MTRPIILSTDDEWRLDLWLLTESHLDAWQVKRLITALRREFVGNRERLIEHGERLTTLVTTDKHASKRTREIVAEFCEWTLRPSLVEMQEAS